jgi:FkbM family methyltransferase
MTIRSAILQTAQRAARLLGREVVPYDPLRTGEARVGRLLQDSGITLALDVGASVGQTGRALRAMGYAGRIVSFEPAESSFRRLAEAAAGDGKWEVRRAAVGAHDGTIQLHLSGTPMSNSVLPMEQRHRDLVPGSGYDGTESVPIIRLDSLVGELYRPGDRVLLKSDTQGYEAAVLSGAREFLQLVNLVRLELLFIGLYEGQAKYYRLMEAMDTAGFDLVEFIPEGIDPGTRRPLWADGWFARR